MPGKVEQGARGPSLGLLIADLTAWTWMDMYLGAARAGMLGWGVQDNPAKPVSDLGLQAEGFDANQQAALSLSSTLRSVEVPSHFSLLYLCLWRVSQQWVSSPLSADTLSGINDHHVQLCRLLTAEEYLANDTNWGKNVDSISIPQTHSRPGDEGPSLIY